MRGRTRGTRERNFAESRGQLLVRVRIGRIGCRWSVPAQFHLVGVQFGNGLVDQFQGGVPVQRPFGRVARCEFRNQVIDGLRNPRLGLLDMRDVFMHVGVSDLDGRIARKWGTPAKSSKSMMPVA